MEQLVLDFADSGLAGPAETIRAPGDRLQVFGDARAAERALVGEVRRDLARVRDEPRRLASPLRIVVPSRSLRLHLGARLVGDRRGPSVAGVAVQTLQAVALEILERSGHALPRGELLLRLFVEEAAAGEPVLAEAFGDLRDGYGAVEASVRDLIDAGFLEVHAEAVDELFEQADDAGPASERRGSTRGSTPGSTEGRARELARAVVRCAAGVLSRFEAAGLDPPGAHFERAAEVLERDPERALPARGVLVHGFADATGSVTGLLEALVRSAGARVFLLEPRAIEPGAPPLAGFAARLVETFERVVGSRAHRVEGSAPSARAAAFVAASPDAEVREVGRRVRTLLDRGAHPESIGVVARDLTSARLALRDCFFELGIPFSGCATAGPGGRAARRLANLLELLQRGPRARVDAWIDCLGDLEPGRLADLRLGLRVAGALDLADVAALRVPSKPLRLPVPESFERRQPAAGAVRISYRSVSEAALRALVERAGALLAALAAWPESASFGAHARCLERLLQGELAWRDADRAPVVESLAQVEAELGDGIAVARHGFTTLFTRHASDLSRAGSIEGGVGGRGGGVQLLGVMEARGRTFDHLFVVGLVRDQFPRQVREDPLLPDRLRRPLLALLPDLPIKARGFEEERFLFAQLAEAGAQVCFSWHRCNAEGRARAPSSFVRWLEAAGLVPVELPASFADPGFCGSRRAAVSAAGSAGRGALAGVLALGLQARAQALGETAAPEAALVEARAAVLREADPPPRRPVRPSGPGRSADDGGLGPWFGFIGPLAAGDRLDPRRAPLYVTQLEGLARCAWQSFLQKGLRLERLPDPAARLPEIDARLVGEVVHAVLERLVERALPRQQGAGERALENLVSRAPTPVAWPDEAWLGQETSRAARRALERRGLALPALLLGLVAAVRPMLARAHQTDFAEPVACLGVEAEAAVRLGNFDVFFRADRADCEGAELRLTDYKTGANKFQQKSPQTRSAALLKRVERGEALQAAVYARWAARGEGGSGRYLYIDPTDPVDAAELRVSGDDRAYAAALEASVGVLAEARRVGAFMPRLANPDGAEHGRCESCRVSEACLRGDSGARLRLRYWSEAQPAEAGQGDSLETVARAALTLGDPKEAS